MENIFLGLAYVVLFVLLGLLLWWASKINVPFHCSKCGQKSEKAEKWSYGEYLWGSRCPHCKHEFYDTPD